MSERSLSSQRYRLIIERLQQLKDELSRVRGQETRLLVERERLERERHDISRRMAEGMPGEHQMSESKAPPPAPEVWRCETCQRPMQCLVCGRADSLFIGADGPVCFNHLPPPPVETRR